MNSTKEDGEEAVMSRFLKGEEISPNDAFSRETFPPLLEW